MTIKEWVARAAAVPVTALVFAVSWGMARPRPEAQVQRTLNLLRADREGLVCADGTRCAVRNADYTLLVFFSLRDCPISLYDTVVLDSLYRTVPPSRLSIVGVGYDLTREEARALATSSGITYPLYLRPDRLERYIANPRPNPGNKPIKLLVSRGGAVVSQTTARTTVEWLRADAERIRARVAR